MSTRPTYKELESKDMELEIEREFFQEAISAVSHPFSAIDSKYYKILIINATSIELYGDHFNQPFCYSWTHEHSTPYHRRRIFQSFKNNKKNKTIGYGGTHPLR